MSNPKRTFARLRETEFSRLAATGHAYLDYTGSGLYPESLVRSHAARLCSTVLGNPHSDSPSAVESTRQVEAARRAVLTFFDADPDEYAVCFTANATAAIKLVAEAFPFAAGSRFVLTADNHNSVNGIREFALRRGASVEYLPLGEELRLTDGSALRALHQTPAPSLFAFPAQSNFSGVRHPLELVRTASAAGYTVLLDAAAFVPTHRLSLRDVNPDFMAVSFYKLFGYPTGVGALVARRTALARLERPWFAGGAVDFVSASAGIHRLRRDEGGFEDGTPNFLAIGLTRDGLEFLTEVGLRSISSHVSALTERLLDALIRLRRAGGAPAVRIYGPRSMKDRGGTIAFNLLDDRGEVVPHENVVAAAAHAGISLRGGCFCNPGATEAAFGHDPTRLRACLEAADEEFTLPRLSECLGGLAVGAVRASLGVASNDEDVDRLVEMLRRLSSAPVEPSHPPAVGAA